VTTLQRLQAMLEKDFDLKPELLQPEASLVDLEIDSLMMIEILFGVEDEFKIAVPSDQAELKAKLKTLGDLVDCIDALVGDAQRGASPGEAAP
jgi:acyl carrier protein